MNNSYTTISFPGLGLEFNPERVFSIGPLNIHIYGILIAFGLLLAVAYAWKRCSQFGIKKDDLIDGILWIVPFAIICTRLYYCIFNWDEYADNPIRVLYIWEGGLAIYGGVIGAIIGIIVFCRVRKIKIGAVLDITMLGFLIGQTIGRWGNFFNREAFGSTTDCFFRMGLFNTATNTWEFHHPTFLYESVWNIVGFIALHFLSRRRQYDGQIALGYVMWYGLGRAMIEGLRTDSLYWGPFRVSQVLAAASCLVALIILLVMMYVEHDPAKLYVNQVAAREAAEAEENIAEAEKNEAEAEENQKN